MARSDIRNHTANFTSVAPVKSLCLIFSTDFTGTVNGVTVDGSVDAELNWDGDSDILAKGMAVVVTTGSVRQSFVVQN